MKRELEETKRKLEEVEGGSKRQKTTTEVPKFQRSIEEDGKCWVQMRGLPWQVTVEQIQAFFEVSILH